jgi:hypothetical protein
VFVGKGGDVAVGVDVGGRGVGVSVGSGVSVGVDVLVGVVVDVDVGVSVGVSVGLLVDVAVGVGVAVGSVVGVALGSVVATGPQATRVAMQSNGISVLSGLIGHPPQVTRPWTPVGRLSVRRSRAVPCETEVPSWSVNSTVSEVPFDVKELIPLPLTL